MMVKKLIKRTEFAQLAGTSAANVTKLCTRGLRAATEGKMIDVAHPDAVAYLEKRMNPTTPTPRKAAAKPKPKAEKPAAKPVRGTAARNQKRQQQPVHEKFNYDMPENIAQYADMTLREILLRFGTQPAFEAWLKSAKALEDLREKRLKNASAEGEVISRTMVSKHVIGMIDATMDRLLTDAPKAITRRIMSAVKAKQTPEEMESTVVRILSDQLKQVKQNSIRLLRDA